MSFSGVRMIKSCRKACRCLQCNRIIEVGQPKATLSGVYEGDFYSCDEHPECYAAAEEYGSAPTWTSDARPMLCEDIDRKYDGPWLLEEFPVVAARLGITATPATQGGEAP